MTALENLIDSYEALYGSTGIESNTELIAAARSEREELVAACRVLLDELDDAFISNNYDHIDPLALSDILAKHATREKP